MGEKLQEAEKGMLDLEQELLRRSADFRMAYRAGDDYVVTGQIPTFIDSADFVLGFESGRIFRLTQQHPEQNVKVLMNSENLDMAALIGAATHRALEQEIRDVNWTDVSFVLSNAAETIEA